MKKISLYCTVSLYFCEYLTSDAKKTNSATATKSQKYFLNSDAKQNENVIFFFSIYNDAREKNVKK